MATVCDDTETMYRPAIYKISNYQPDGCTNPSCDIEKIPIQVTSNIGCYRNVARAGQQIKVAGTLEKAQSTKDGSSLLPSCRWNSHFRRRIHMANLNLRDRDAIQSAEGIIFRVFGYCHPANAYLCDAEYASSKIFQLHRPTSATRRQKRTLLQILQRRRHETRRQKVSAVPC